MKQNLRVSLGAVVLALATLTAVIYAWINFRQRESYDIPDDGVAWLDTSHGAKAWKVTPNSPAARAGVRPDDVVIAINDVPVDTQVQVTKRLWRAGLWTQVRYKLLRDGREFETPLVTAPAEKPASIENYERVVGLLYLFIGLFIFIRRWNAPRAVHFFVFCLASFVLFSFHYSGKLDAFDYEVYWAKIASLMLAPALLFHFALVFPERAEAAARSFSKLALVYGPPALLLLFHISLALNALGFVPWLGSRVLIDKIEYSYLGIYFIAAAIVFYKSFQEAPSGVLRQQLKWLTGGTLAGSLAVRASLCDPFRPGRGAAVVDEILRTQPRADSSVLRLRHHPLPLDGCGHHLQARLGVHRCHRGRRFYLFRAGRPNCADLLTSRRPVRSAA